MKERVNIFQYSDYKLFIIDFGKKNEGRGFFLRLSKKLGVHPTLLSHIFKGEKNLSLDQAYKLSGIIELNFHETEFFLLLINYERAFDRELKNFYSEKIQGTQKSYQYMDYQLQEKDTMSYEEKALLYSDWVYLAIYHLLNLPEVYSIEKISSYFEIPFQEVKERIGDLERMGLVQQEEDGYKMLKKYSHIKADDKLIWNFHKSWRLKFFEKRSSLKDHELVFTGVFSSSKENILKVKREIQQLIESSMEKLKTEAPAEELMCLSLDWFNV